MRRHVLGEQDPASKAVAAGWRDSRLLVPIEKVKERLGAELFQEPREYGWVGDGGFIMHDVLDDGSMVQCIVCCLDDRPGSSVERKGILTREDLEESFATWLTGKGIARGMIDVSY